MLIELLFAVAATTAPAKPAQYPVPLRGSWHIGPEPCSLPAHSGSDGLMTIRRDAVQAYESTFTAFSIRPVPGRRSTWELEELEEYGGETRRLRRTISMAGNALIATEGRSRTAYVRCTGRLPRR